MKKTMIGVMGILLCILTVLERNLVTKAAEGEDTYISETAYQACIDYGEEYGVCPELLMAIIERESSGWPEAENKDCKGLMQINVKYHTERMEELGVTDLFEEEQNIHVGADILAELFEKYEDIYLVLMCYNMGERKAIRRYEQGTYSCYAVSIAERAEELERLHGK